MSRQTGSLQPGDALVAKQWLPLAVLLLSSSSTGGVPGASGLSSSCIISASDRVGGDVGDGTGAAVAIGGVVTMGAAVTLVGGRMGAATGGTVVGGGV